MDWLHAHGEVSRLREELRNLANEMTILRRAAIVYVIFGVALVAIAGYLAGTETNPVIKTFLWIAAVASGIHYAKKSGALLQRYQINNEQFKLKVEQWILAGLQRNLLKAKAENDAPEETAAEQNETHL